MVSLIYVQGSESRLTRRVSEDCGEVAGLPAGALASELDTSLVVDSADKVDGEVPDDGHVFRTMSRSQARLVFAEGDVEDPVEAVLNGPVAANGFCCATGRQGRGRDVVSGLEAAAVFQFGT